MTGSLTANERAIVSKVFRGVATGDPYALKDALLSLAKADGPVDHSMLLEQMSTMLASYASTDLSDINIGTAFVDVIEILRTQNLTLPPSFTMLARGFLTLEGVLTDIAPSINIVDIVSVHVKKQMKTLSYIEGKAQDLLLNTAESSEAMGHGTAAGYQRCNLPGGKPSCPLADIGWPVCGFEHRVHDAHAAPDLRCAAARGPRLPGRVRARRVRDRACRFDPSSTGERREDQVGDS